MENVIVYRDNDTLQHHGIKGQKWGLRRFQNPDGTLTPAGKARYLKALSTYQRNAGNMGRSVAGSAVTSGLLGAAAGFGITAAESGSREAAAISAIMSGGASAILGGSVAAAKNAITGAKLNKAIAIMEQFKQMYGNKSVYEVTKDLKLEKKIEEVTKDPNLEKKIEEVTKSKDFWPNERKHDREFLERMDNPVHVDYLSDGSLDRLWAMKKAGASWDQLYKEKDRLERLEAKMKS